MTNSEFIEATRRIEAYFDKDYKTEQLQEMFRELKYMDIERYRQLVSAVIRRCNFLPKVVNFVEADKEITYVPKQNESQKIECKKCNNTGYLIYTKLIKDGHREFRHQYACICSCGNAKKYNGTDFYTPLAQELGIGG